MRRELEPQARAALDRETLKCVGSDLERKFPIALLLYAVLGALAWFTMGPGKVIVWGKPVEMRWIPLIVLGALALRTLMARQAERIRGDGDEEDGA